MGTVKNFLKETDTIEVEFDTKKGVSYQYCVEKEIRARKVKLARSAEKKKTGEVRGAHNDWCNCRSKVDGE